MERKWYNIDYICTTILTCFFIVSFLSYMISTYPNRENEVAHNIALVATGLWFIGFFPVVIVETLRVYNRYKKGMGKIVRYKETVYKVKDNALYLTWLGIQDISEIIGIDKLVNLKALYLFDNNISEINRLENLINLEILHLTGNQVTEISGLTSLTKLRVLCLDRNKINEIKGLETLTELQVLKLDNNQIPKIDLERLGGLNSNGEANYPQRFVEFCRKNKEN